MAWQPARFKGKDVWIEVDDRGLPKAAGGRVPMRYSGAPGARIYRASLSRVERGGDPPVELPAGVPADTGGGGARRKRRGSGFGSAGSRSQAQARAARESAAELLASLPDDVAICFTDGACKGNPGPAGAGCVVRLPDGSRHEDWRALGQGTNNIGELTAIGMAMDILDREGFEGAAHVLTDSQYSLGVLVQGWKAKANKELIASVKDRLRGRDVTIHWIAGHVGIPDNERADALANKGVEQSRRGTMR